MELQKKQAGFFSQMFVILSCLLTMILVEVFEELGEVAGYRSSQTRIAQDSIDEAKETFDFAVETGIQYTRGSILMI